MLYTLIVFLIGLVVGWNIPQPTIAKIVIQKIKTFLYNQLNNKD